MAVRLKRPSSADENTKTQTPRPKPLRLGRLTWRLSASRGVATVAVCAATEPARFARRPTRRASPRFSSRTESPMSDVGATTEARRAKTHFPPQIVFVVARVPSALAPAFRLRAERRMKPGRHKTVQSATCHTSPPFVGWGVLSRRRALRCNAEATRAARNQHGGALGPDRQRAREQDILTLVGMYRISHTTVEHITLRKIPIECPSPRARRREGSRSERGRF